jgi:hypothetical protein
MILYRLLFPDRVIKMLKERKLWFIIRRLELSKLPGTVVLQNEVVANALASKCFKTQQEVERAIAALQRDGHLSPEGEYNNIVYQPGLRTNPASDKHFAIQYFWPKVADAFGFSNIIGIIIAIFIGISTLDPQSLGYKLFERIMSHK